MILDKIELNESFRTIKNVESIRAFYDEPIIKPKDVPEGDKIDMARGIDYKFKRTTQ